MRVYIGHVLNGVGQSVDESSIDTARCCRESPESNVKSGYSVLGQVLIPSGDKGTVGSFVWS